MRGTGSSCKPVRLDGGWSRVYPLNTLQFLKFVTQLEQRHLAAQNVIQLPTGSLILKSSANHPIVLWTPASIKMATISFNSFLESRKREEFEREELLTHRNPSYDSTSIHIGGTENSIKGKENERLTGFHREMDELISHGSGIMGQLRDQRSTLSGARRKLLEIGNTLGLSNTIMRLIEKRTFQDKLILFGGMFIFLLVILLIWIYFL